MPKKPKPEPYPTYPEHDKLRVVRDKSQAIGEFLEWLEEKHFVELQQRFVREEDEEGEPVYRNSEGEVVPDWPPPQSCGLYERNSQMRREREQREGIERRLIPHPGGEILRPFPMHKEKLLAEFFGIDRNKLEEEKRAMLEQCRRMNS